MKELIKLQQQLINNLTLQLLFPEPTTRKAEKNYVLLREKEEKLRDKISELSESKDHSVDVNETMDDEEIWKEANLYVDKIRYNDNHTFWDAFVDGMKTMRGKLTKPDQQANETISDVEVMAYFNLHSHTMLNEAGIPVPYFKRSDILEFAKWIRSKLTK